MSERPMCPECEQPMHRSEEAQSDWWWCNHCEHTYTQNQLDNLRDAACERRDEARAAEGNQFYTPLPYESPRR